MVVEVLREVRNRRDKIKCPKCGEVMEFVEVYTPQRDSWKPITLDHIASEPMRFETKKSLQDYCREHNLESGALL